MSKKNAIHTLFLQHINLFILFKILYFFSFDKNASSVLIYILIVYKFYHY